MSEVPIGSPTRLRKIEPDKRLEKIIDMNKAIVEMNAEIVRVLAKPMYIAEDPDHRGQSDG